MPWAVLKIRPSLEPSAGKV